MSKLQKSFDAKAFLAKHKSYVTPERLKILKQLVKKDWFKASDETVQDDLAMLPQKGPENHDGFLENLVSRPSEIGDIVVLSMIDLPRGYYTLIPIFEVQNKYTKRVYVYEFAGMRQGVPAGVKGIVLIRPDDNSEPTDFVILSAEKFATAKKTYDLMGGYAKTELGEHLNEEGKIRNAIREVQEETGVRTLKVSDVQLLGSHSVDSGVISHEPELFVAYITAKEARKISTHAKNIDDTEMNTYVHIMSLEKLPELVHECTNALLLAALLKATGAGHIPKRFLVGDNA